MDDEWLNRRLSSIKRSGRLIISNEPNFDIQMLSPSNYYSILSLLKYLDISMTKSETLKNIPFLPRIKTFQANKTNFSNFENFKVLANASNFSLKGTPVSKHPHYKLSLFLAVGQGIVTIDGKVISKKLRKRAELYPPMAVNLVNKGWMAEYPVPDEMRFKILCDKFGISYSEYVAHPKIDEDLQLAEDEMFEIDHVLDGIDESFESHIESLRDKHESMIRKGQAIFGIFDYIEDENIEVAEKVSSIFKSHRISIDNSSDESVLRAIRDLCCVLNNSRSKSTTSEVMPEDL